MMAMWLGRAGFWGMVSGKGRGRGEMKAKLFLIIALLFWPNYG